MASGVLVYPTDRPAYSRLCRLLSLGKRRAGKAKCNLDWPDLPDFAEGLVAVLVPDRGRRGLRPAAAAAEGDLRRRRLSGAQPAPPAGRRAAPARPVQPRRPGRRADRRHQRRAVPPSRAPAAAGRGHLRAPRLHHRRTGLPPRAPRRPAPEAGRGDAPPLRPIPRGPGPHRWRSPSAAASRSRS